MRKDWHLKHRPSQLDDLVGQKSVVDTLKQSCKLDRYANSYFLSGVKGCGKTSTARILATLMNCENVVDGRLCGKCRACQTIPRDMSSDVIELDGAAHGKVDDISGLIEGAKWSPVELKRKIYLIDEAHRLTGSAVSALLKITENPPDYLTFIFCTTDPDKVIDTIKSRSQRFNFRRLTSNEIMLRLKAIAGQENVDIDEESLFIIAKKSGGSMRDAIVALEQISVALGDNEGSKITFEKTEKYFGLPSKHIIFNIIGSMVDGNFPLLMDQVNDLLMSNVGSQEVAFEISEILRNIMLVKINKGKCPWMELPDSEITELLKFSGKIGLGQLDKISRQFSSIKKELEYSINERWVLESVLIHCAAILKGK
jgi:DNA polymerase III subunit gamma/tau